MPPAPYHRRDDPVQSSVENAFGASLPEGKGPPKSSERLPVVKVGFRPASIARDDVDHFWSPTGNRAYNTSDDEEFDLLETTYRNTWTHWVSVNPVAVKLIKTFTLIFLWYLFSILLSL